MHERRVQRVPERVTVQRGDDALRQPRLYPGEHSLKLVGEVVELVLLGHVRGRRVRSHGPVFTALPVARLNLRPTGLQSSDLSSSGPSSSGAAIRQAAHARSYSAASSPRPMKTSSLRPFASSQGSAVNRSRTA